MTIADLHIPSKDIFVIIPAKDEERYIGELIEQLTQLKFDRIVLVNDMSKDNTRAVGESYPNVTVIDHAVNLGAGAATQTGIAYAIQNKAQIIATIDADLQHNPKDLVRLIHKLHLSQADLVIGSRFKQKNDIPFSRVCYNYVGNIISYLLTGIYVTDSQSGLKVMNRRLARRLKLNYNGFEFCMEIIKRAHIDKRKVVEVPINVTYTAHTTKKGQNFLSGLRMLSRILSPFS